MWQQPFIENISGALKDEPRLIGLFLGGSFGKGEADAYSDVDLLAIVAHDDQEDFASIWKQRLESLIPIIFWYELAKGARILNAIGEGWQRIDLVLADKAILAKYSKDSLRPLIDGQGLYGNLPDTIPWPGPNRGQISSLINEFIRILGLLPVGLRREEYQTCLMGQDLLRTSLFHLLTEEIERVDKGGMLAWSRRFSPEQLALLGSIPYASPTRQSIIDAQLAAATVFLPRARSLADKWNIEWPQAFEDATWKNLKATLGIEKPQGI